MFIINGEKLGSILRDTDQPQAQVQVEEDAEQGYSSMTVPELKAEIESRNEGREEADLLSADGKKADLVATLEGDD